MDWDRINDVLDRANLEFERQELDDLRSYEMDNFNFGDDQTNQEFESIEDVEENQIQEEEEGGDDTQQYMSHIIGLTLAVTEQTGVSDDDALDAIVKVAGEMAESGSLPEMPDIEVASEKDLSKWVDAEKSSNLLSRVVNYITTQCS